MDLLNWRKEKGLSRLKFSKLSGIPISTIVKHEAGKKTRKETLDNLEKKMDCWRLRQSIFFA